jgi:hypothetical protein
VNVQASAERENAKRRSEFYCIQRNLLLLVGSVRCDPSHPTERV